MARHTTTSWILAGSILVALIGVLGPQPNAQGVILLWGLACSASILWRARSLQPAARRFFTTLGLVALLIAIGIIVRTIHGMAIGEDQPIPSPADFVHVPAYLVFAFASYYLLRRRSTRADPDAWLDAISAGLSIVLLMWAGFFSNYLFDAEVAGSAIAMNSLYNALLLVALTLVFRITSVPGHRPFSYYLVGMAFFSAFFVDVAAAYSLAQGSGVIVSVVLSPITYGFGAAAAFHESANHVTDKQEEVEIRVGPLRLLLIALGVVGPIVVLVAHEPVNRTSGTVIAVLATLLTAIVMTRVYRLLMAQQHDADRETQLATEVGSLAKLASRKEIVDALPRALSRILNRRVAPTNAATDRTIPLPDSLSAPRLHLEISPFLDRPAEFRMARSLIRDAGFIADSVEGIEAMARQKSETEANRKIAINERRFRALVQNASDLVVLLGDNAKITYMSEAVERVLGYPAADFEGKLVGSLVHPADRQNAAERVLSLVDDEAVNSETFEVRATHKDGTLRLFECTATDMTRVEGVEGVVINATDVTDVRSLEQDLLNAETTDALTLMLNRHAFIDEVTSALRRASLTNSSITVTIINLDEFRQINEGLGPALADQVLIEAAQAVRSSIRLSDSVARLSGDEFAVLMPGNYSATEAIASVERIIEALSDPINVGGKRIRLQATAGVVVERDTSARGESLLRNADTALEHAKNAARGKAMLYEDAMGEAASERIEIRNSLDTAITNDEMRLVYQPVIDVASGQIVSMEALARWQHPVRGAITPSVFVPIAESSGFIHTLGAWALETVCRQVVDWEAEGLSGFSVSVNMSGHQLRRDDIIPTMRRIVANSGVDPARIVIEITESVLIDDTDFIHDRIKAIRGMGLKLSIDDFGTGYSSLSYLQRYDFDVLKIDRSFVMALGQNETSKRHEIVRSIVSLARGLGAITVAEGVEEESEYRVLEALGCDTAQGYLFFRPLEIELIPDVLKSQSLMQRAA